MLKINPMVNTFLNCFCEYILQVSNSNGVFGVMPIENGELGKSGTKVAIELGAISNRPTYRIKYRK